MLHLTLILHLTPPIALRAVAQEAILARHSLLLRVCPSRRPRRKEPAIDSGNTRTDQTYLNSEDRSKLPCLDWIPFSRANHGRVQSSHGHRSRGHIRREPSLVTQSRTMRYHPSNHARRRQSRPWILLYTRAFCVPIIAISRPHHWRKIRKESTLLLSPSRCTNKMSSRRLSQRLQEQLQHPSRLQPRSTTGDQGPDQGIYVEAAKNPSLANPSRLPMVVSQVDITSSASSASLADRLSSRPTST